MSARRAAAETRRSGSRLTRPPHARSPIALQVSEQRRGVRKFWNLASTATEDTLWIYDVVGFDMFDEGITAASFAKELAQLKGKRLTVRINSPGGDVFDGLAIKNLLADHPGDVTVKVDGLAASIASVIAQAGDRIIMGPNAQMMIHDASGGAWGSAPDLREVADLLDMISDNIADVYAKRAGGEAKDWRKVMRGEQWYTADEAVAAGLADEVADAPEKATPDGAKAQADRYRVAARWCRDLFPAHGAIAAGYEAAAEALETEAELGVVDTDDTEAEPDERDVEKVPAPNAPAAPADGGEGDDPLPAPSPPAVPIEALGDLSSKIRAAVAPITIDLGDWRSWFAEAPSAPEPARNMPVNLGPPPARPEPEPAPAANPLAEHILVAINSAATSRPEPAVPDRGDTPPEQDPPFRLDVNAFRRAVREARF